MENATKAEKNLCGQIAFLGWIRDYSTKELCSVGGEANNATTNFNNDNALFVGCKGQLLAGEADVLVNHEGRVHNATKLSVTTPLSADFIDQHFTNGVDDMIVQANRYLLFYPFPKWHNDSFASDFMNYFMIKHSKDSRLVDPNLPLPSLEDVTQRLYPVYSKLFAIWLGINKEKLLVPTNPDSKRLTDGLSAELHIRLFLIKPLFIIAECILSLYVIVAFILYLYRPGRFLPRLPTSIAATIALFAASSAVRDMRGTSLLTKKEREARLQELDKRYGYGTFLGVDGRLHVGIEKEPMVEVAPIPGLVNRVTTGFSKRSRKFARFAAP
jgi:hypothetical protein